MAEFDALDKDFFSELTFFAPVDGEIEDKTEPTQEELKIIEEELGQWRKLYSSPLGKAIKAMIRSEKAKAVATVMTSVASINESLSFRTLAMLKAEAVGAYQVWDYLEKRPMDLMKRKMFFEKKSQKGKPRKKTLTKGKDVR